MAFMRTFRRAAAVLWIAGAAACAPANDTAGANQTSDSADGVALLNVSYDVMRDFYKEFNPLFEAHYRAVHAGKSVSVKQSHGGSSKQALSVANGLQADVVTMNQSSDIELLQKRGLVADNWADALPNHAVPFTSTTVFLVRAGNPKNIRDWDDLTREDVSLVITNPKTGGNGRYTFLAAYGYALKTAGGDETAARAFVQKLFARAAVLEAGGRSATTTFTQRGIGDVLITFENEANQMAKVIEPGKYTIVYPQYSVAAENPVAVVSAVAAQKGTEQAAKEYLEYLWSEEGQHLAAKLYLRPADEKILAQYSAQFPPIETFRATEVFGAWDDLMQKFFADGGVFDEIAKR